MLFDYMVCVQHEVTGSLPFVFVTQLCKSSRVMLSVMSCTRHLLKIFDNLTVVATPFA